MKSWLKVPAVGIFVLATWMAVRAAENDASNEKAIEAVGERWAAAVSERDAKALGEILADDYFLTMSDGSTKNKQQYIELSTSANLKIDEVNADNKEFRFYDSTAVETGRLTLTGTHNGQSFTVQERYTVVFVFADNRWQPTVEQLTRIP